MFQDSATFSRRIRELIAYLETENRQQAEIAMVDDVAFLRGLLKPPPDRDKPSSFGAREPMVQANDRIRETLVAYQHARSYLTRSDFPGALRAATKALETWEPKPTEPKEDAPNAEDFDLGDQGQSGG